MNSINRDLAGGQSRDSFLEEGRYERFLMGQQAQQGCERGNGQEVTKARKLTAVQKYIAADNPIETTIMPHDAVKPSLQCLGLHRN